MVAGLIAFADISTRRLINKYARREIVKNNDNNKLI